MIRDEYLRRLVDGAHLDLYLSATDGARVYWPWRMQPVHEADERHRNACEHYIVDSSFKDESITNSDVLNAAAALDAEVAVLADVYQDKDATVDVILDGLELADEHRFDGDLMVPLQPPHHECYVELEGQADLYAVGGVKDASDTEKIQAAKAVREVAGPEIHLHGLGYGATDRIASAVRESPPLLDSVDYSTPIQSAMHVSVEPGKERMSVVAAHSAAQLVQDLRRFSEFPNSAENSTHQTTLAQADGGRNVQSLNTDGNPHPHAGGGSQ